jgi:hypothetical protein
LTCSPPGQKSERRSARGWFLADTDPNECEGNAKVAILATVAERASESEDTFRSEAEILSVDWHIEAQASSASLCATWREETLKRPVGFAGRIATSDGQIEREGRPPRSGADA